MYLDNVHNVISEILGETGISSVDLQQVFVSALEHSVFLFVILSQPLKRKAKKKHDELF